MNQDEVKDKKRTGRPSKFSKSDEKLLRISSLPDDLSQVLSKDLPQHP